MPGLGSNKQELSSTSIYIIRHGETEWNTSGRKQGHLDSPLTSVGIAQAAAVANRLSIETFSTLYSSDLGRAHATAASIAVQTGHTVLLEKGLRERNFGIFQGLTDAESKRKYPEEYRSFTTGDADYRIPEGEGAQEFFVRATNCLEQVVARHAGETIAIITHGGVLDAFVRFVFNVSLLTPRQVTLWNAALNSFSRDDNRWTLNMWGDRNHLHNIGTRDDISVTRAEPPAINMRPNSTRYES